MDGNVFCTVLKRRSVIRCDNIKSGTKREDGRSTFSGYGNCHKSKRDIVTGYYTSYWRLLWKTNFYHPDLRARVEDTVEKYICGKFEFSQAIADLNRYVVTDAFSWESEKVTYWHRDTAQCVVKYLAGQVAHNFRKDGRTEIVPYITTQNYRKNLEMTLLIGADHGTGA
jgi:hypothetical protein